MAERHQGIWNGINKQEPSSDVSYWQSRCQSDKIRSLPRRSAEVTPTSGLRRFSQGRLYCWDSSGARTEPVSSVADVRCLRAPPLGSGGASGRQLRNRQYRRALCYLDLGGNLPFGNAQDRLFGKGQVTG